MIRIAPSILAADFSKLEEDIKKVERAGADYLHIDVMDGHFVPNITVGPQIIKLIRRCTGMIFDVHLMIENPDLFIDDFIDAGADILTVHAEGNCNLHRTIQKIKSKGKKAGVALNPATHPSVLEWVLNDIDLVLVMTVNPGFGGQMFIESMLDKIKIVANMVRERRLHVDVEVDGGIDLKNIYSVTQAGAEIVVAGTSIYNAVNPAKVIEDMREAAYKEKMIEE